MNNNLVKRLRDCEFMGMPDARLDYSTAHEAADRIEALEAKGLANRVAIMKLEAKLEKAFVALSDLADCVDLGCFCSEMEQATVMDKARATLMELTGGKDE